MSLSRKSSPRGETTMPKKKKKAGNVISVNFGQAKKLLYALDVSLIGGPITQTFAKANPYIWRTIEIRGDQTLADLHECIFHAFDRDDPHMYEFQVGGDRPMDPKARRYGLSPENEPLDPRLTGNVSTTTIESLKLKVNDLFGYWFDFGDDWWHQVQVLGITDDFPPDDYPFVSDWEGESPPQYADFENDENYDFEDDLDDSELDDDVAFLRELIANPDLLVESMMDQFSMERREKIETKSLKPDTTLSAALKKLPALWVEAICQQYDIDTPRLVADKIRVLTKVLPDKEILEKAWSRLPEPSRRMLHYLVVEKEGWVLKGVFSRRFGKDEDCSWFWNEGHTPITPLGLLRLNGLATVGMRTRKGRKERIVSVPYELRPMLATIAETEGAFDNAPPMPEKESLYEELGDELDDEPMLLQVVPDEDILMPDEMDLPTFLEEVSPDPAHARYYERALVRFCGELHENEADLQREFLVRMTGMENVAIRKKAYHVGFNFFGKSFLEPALNDRAKSLRDWAKQKLSLDQGKLF